MEFDNNKPIYLQIADTICEKILSGEHKPEDRILSVREFSAEVGVNPNTVQRSYESLTMAGIIYNKRGIGYFISPDGLEKVLERERKYFYENELPQFMKRVKLLNIDLKNLINE